MEEKTCAVIPYGKVCDFLLENTFAAENTPEGCRLIYISETYQAEIMLEDVFIENKNVYIESVKCVEKGTEISFASDNGERRVLIINKLRASVKIFDLRPVDSDDPFETVARCLSEAADILRLFGGEVLCPEEIEAAKAGDVIEILETPHLTPYCGEEELDRAAKYLHMINDPFENYVLDYIFAKGGRKERRALSRLVYAAENSRLKKTLVEKYLTLCIGTNETREKNPFVNWKKWKDVSLAADEAAARSGFDGKFPNYFKGAKYMRFSLGYSYLYDDDGRRFLYDAALAFGIDSEKHERFRSVGGHDRIILRIMETNNTKAELVKALDIVFLSVDRITDKTNPPDEFYTLADIRQYDRSWSRQLTLLGLTVGFFGLFVFAALIIFATMSMGETILCCCSSLIFAALTASSGYFGIYLKKHPKFIFKSKI